MNTNALLYPVLRINDQSVIRFDTHRELQTVPCFALDKPEFINSFFIDRNSRMFSVIKIENVRISWNPIKLLEKHRKCVILYNLDDPVDLGFEEAKHLVIGEILKNNRFNQGGESKKRFIKRMSDYRNMADLIKSISLYGESWY